MRERGQRVCVCVCVCVRERERERAQNLITQGLRFSAIACSYNLFLLIYMPVHTKQTNNIDSYDNDYRCQWGVGRERENVCVRLCYDIYCARAYFPAVTKHNSANEYSMRRPG